MVIALGVIAAIIAIVLMIKVVAAITGIILTLVIAGLIGILADRIVPGKLPYGVIGAIGAGWLGAILGSWIFGSFGLAIFGIHVIPALVGAIILAFGANVVTKATGSKRLGGGGKYKAIDRW